MPKEHRSLPFPDSTTKPLPKEAASNNGTSLSTYTVMPMGQSGEHVGIDASVQYHEVS